MKINHLVGPLVVVAALLAGPVFGELQLVDNFDQYDTGLLDTVKVDSPPNGDFGGVWVCTHNNTGNVQVSNRDGSRTLDFFCTSAGDIRGAAINELTHPVAVDGQGTLFFRFMLRVASDEEPRSYMGFHWRQEGTSLSRSPDAVLVGFGAVDDGDDGFNVTLTDGTTVLKPNLVRGQWYNAWIVANNAEQTFDLFISEATGPDGPATQPTVDDIVVIDMPYPNPVEAALDGAAFISDSGDGRGTRTYVDEIHWAPEQGVTVPVVRNQTPANFTTGVPVDDTLTWDPPDDPNIVEILGYDVYLDPNETDVRGGLGSVLVSAMQDETTYAPDPYLLPDETYFWRVDIHAEDANQDQKLYPGLVRQFSTETSAPVILEQPSNLLIAAGDTAEITVLAESFFEINYQWYKSLDDAIDPDTDELLAGATDATLVLDNVSLADEAFYYCRVENDFDTLYTDAVQLVTRKLLAWYPFEQNADDAVGDNDGTDFGNVQFTEGIVTADGQQYAADPNGANYFIVLDTETVYPRHGFGNGLEHFTYSAWIKVEEGQHGHVFGTMNDDANTAIEFRVKPDGSVRTWLREDNNTRLAPRSEPELVWDGQWHHLVSTYDGSVARIYVDGAEVGSDAGPTLTNFVPWQYPMILLGRNDRGQVDWHFDGVADDLRIYNYPMTPAQIAELYHDVTGEAVCVERPEFDFTGDCVVGLADFALLINEWLWDGFYDPEQ